ncbi:hypothetical protein B296_00056169, partial [Ensete ventricosum]
ALQRLKTSEKELNEVWSNLVEIQRLLKEARVRARKMDDELLQYVKAPENARGELPRQAIDRYKESIGFKEALKRMGRVTYEYGYRVALARFHAVHPDSKVEDPFTIHPEDNLVSMERHAECYNVLCRIAAAILKFEGRKAEAGRERFALYLGSEWGIAF